MPRDLLPRPGQLRTLAIGTLLGSAGSSLLVTSLVLYFTRIVGLSGAEVAIGLTLGGALGLLVGVPLGHLADARGARELLLVLLVAQALATLSYVFVASFVAFLAASCVVVTLERGGAAVRQGVIARALPAEGRVRALAYLRAVTNVGFGAGSVVATIGIAIDTRTGYRAMIVADALAFLGVAAISVHLTHLPTVATTGGGPRLVVLRDRPYLVVIALTALLSVHNSILDVGLPLWVSQHTAAPTAIVGVIFVLNCLVVTLFSMRLAVGSEAPPGAARAALRSGATVLVACGLLASSGSLPVLAAAGVLVLAMLVQAVAEMQAAASQWGLSLGLAPDSRQGQYQGAASTGLAFGLMLGPLVMAAVVAVGAAGWLAFGGVMLAVGAATAPATRWALADRPSRAVRYP